MSDEPTPDAPPAGPASAAPPAPEARPDEAWFDAVNARAELPAIQAAIEARLAEGSPCEPILRRLGGRDPLVITELLLGPRASVGGAWSALRLALIDLLELGMRPGSLYLRMAAVAGDPEEEAAVLSAAVARHRDAPWIRTLSGRVEGPMRGRTQLRALSASPSFPELCREWYQAGGRAALIELAAAPPRLEAFAALAEAEDREALIEAAARALSESPTAPVPAWLSAIWGPDLDEMMVQIIDRIEAAPARAALIPWLRSSPRALLHLRAAQRER